jgi:hypothetical protein
MMTGRSFPDADAYGAGFEDMPRRFQDRSGPRTASGWPCRCAPCVPGVLPTTSRRSPTKRWRSSRPRSTPRRTSFWLMARGRRRAAITCSSRRRTSRGGGWMTPTARSSRSGSLSARSSTTRRRRCSSRRRAAAPTASAQRPRRGIRLGSPPSLPGQTARLASGHGLRSPGLTSAHYAAMLEVR